MKTNLEKNKKKLGNMDFLKTWLWTSKLHKLYTLKNGVTSGICIIYSITVIVHVLDCKGELTLTSGCQCIKKGKSSKVKQCLLGTLEQEI